MSDLSRVEQLLRNALGEDVYEVTPQSRVEELLVQLNELIEGISASVDPEELTSIVTAWLAENIHDGAVVDTSLSVAGAAAESKKTGEEIGQLKEDLTQLSDTIGSYFALSNWETSAYINTNVAVGTVVNTTPVSVNAYAYMIISVKKGDKFLVSGQGGNKSRLWAFTDASYKLLSKTNITDAQQSNVSLTASADGYLIVNSYTGTSVTYFVKRYTVTKLSSGYINVNRLIHPFGYINTNVNVGSAVTIAPVYSSSFCFAITPINTGDIVRISGTGGNASRLWAFLDSSYKLTSKSSGDLTEHNLELTAEVDGYFVFNSTNLISNTYPPNIDLYTRTLESACDTFLQNEAYVGRNKGNDVLSAFTNITCCGDSLTESVVFTAGNSQQTYVTRDAYKTYPNLLAHKIDATAETLASSGGTASGWWGLFADRIVSKTNHLVIVYLGTNGSLTDTLDTDASGDDYTQYANTDTGNYCKIVAKALDVGAKVLLIKPYIGTDIYTTRAVIDKIAEKFSVAVVDVPYLSERCYHLYPDGSEVNTTHYNDLGYAAFTDSLIKNVGALPNTMLARLIPT